METIDAPGNVGLKDQCLALKWIKKNISAFGGDENNITILGISAGAVCVEAHILSDCSKGLFNKTVIQSGSTLCSWSFVDCYNIINERLLKKLHYNGDDNPQSKCDFLIKIDSRTLMKETKELLTDQELKNGVVVPFFPTVTNIPDYENFLFVKPSAIFKSGQYTKVPTICGDMEKEGMIYWAYFTNSLINRLQCGDYDYCLPDWIKNDRDQIINMARKVYGEAGNVKVADYFGDLIFSGPVEKSLEYKLKDNQLIYHYNFLYDGGINFMKRNLKIKEKGACHADDLTFLGPNDKVTKALYGIPHDKIVMQKYIEMWTDFAKFG